MKISRHLAVLLAATLVATLWLALEPAASDDALVALAPRASSRATSVAPRAADATRVDAPVAIDLRAGRSPWPPLVDGSVTAWQPPPPPVAVVAAAIEAPPPPPAPQAPPFPYTLVGRFEDASGAHALLSNATRTISARAGDVIDGQWRVDATPPGRVELTWVPGSLSQTVAYRPS